MMELSVWEQGEQIGTVTAQQDGLFYIFICKISHHAEQLRRIYVISKWRVEYLGIPYPRREGAELQAKGYEFVTVNELFLSLLHI